MYIYLTLYTLSYSNVSNLNGLSVGHACEAFTAVRFSSIRVNGWCIDVYPKVPLCITQGSFWYSMTIMLWILSTSRLVEPTIFQRTKPHNTHWVLPQMLLWCQIVFSYKKSLVSPPAHAYYLMLWKFTALWHLENWSQWWVFEGCPLFLRSIWGNSSLGQSFLFCCCATCHDQLDCRSSPMFVQPICILISNLLIH